MFKTIGSLFTIHFVLTQSCYFGNSELAPNKRRSYFWTHCQDLNHQNYASKSEWLSFKKFCKIHAKKQG